MSAALLRHAGFEVRTALSDAQALEDLAERSVDVLVIGLGRRDTVGEQLLSAIRELRQSGVIRVIGYGSRRDELGDGADALVSKAQGPAGLLNAITRLT